jgi:signal peptidase I
LRDNARVRRVVGPIAGLAGVLFALATLRLVRRYEVEGRSMLRAYAPGDRLLVEGLTYRTRPPRVGEAVVVRRTGRLDLKRIAAGPGARVTLPEGERVLGAGEWYVLGDNLTESTDSRELGPVRTRDIVGRVWLKY